MRLDVNAHESPSHSGNVPACRGIWLHRKGRAGDLRILETAASNGGCRPECKDFADDS